MYCTVPLTVSIYLYDRKNSLYLYMLFTTDGGKEPFGNYWGWGNGVAFDADNPIWWTDNPNNRPNEKVTWGTLQRH